MEKLDSGLPMCDIDVTILDLAFPLREIDFTSRDLGRLE